MNYKKLKLWAGLNLFLLLALLISGCSGTGSSSAIVPNTGASLNNITAEPPIAPLGTAALPKSGGSQQSVPGFKIPATPAAAMPSSSTGAQVVAGALPTPTAFTLLLGTNGTLGDYLTDEDGQSLYIFVKDTSTTSACNGACAALWVPLIGSATGGSGVTGSMVGQITRQDGSMQVSYNGHPLYFFSKDVNQEDLKGQGYGSGKWWVISPTGDPIDKMLNGTTVSPAMMTTSTP